MVYNRYRVAHLKIVKLTCLIALCAAFAPAQSTSSQAGSGRKANQRIAPAPTPTPSAIVAAQPPTESIDDDEIIKVSTQLVSLPVRVMDRKGRFIAGLKQDEFSVTEDGVEQEISYFSTEEEPFTVVLMLDMSYSTTFKISEIQSAAIAFIDQLRPVDKVAVVSFDQDVHVLCKPTSDRKQIYGAIRSTKIATGTSLYEAVDHVMNSLTRSVDGRKAIILFTDGVDTTSRLSSDLANLSDAMEFDALIYPIHYDTFSDVQTMKNGGAARGVVVPPISDPTKPLSAADILLSTVKTAETPNSQGTTPEEYKKAAEYMDELALRTGGRLYEATSLTNLADAYSRIASELREFYSIGYYPKAEMTGKKRSIKVKVGREGVVVRAREEFITRKVKR
ncbi:MAG TPA: VWA domain-containing protein [Pyrinomonadaceae bacterium]|nr:VWA domain-containing protein [Pyrinomonadaceae bacterium]